MTDYTTIRVSQDAKAEAQQAKRDNETWNDYIQRCTDEPPEMQELVKMGDVEEVINAYTCDLATLGNVKDLADNDSESIDYAEIETRLKRVLEEVLHG